MAPEVAQTIRIERDLNSPLIEGISPNRQTELPASCLRTKQALQVPPRHLSHRCRKVYMRLANPQSEVQWVHPKGRSDQL